MATIKNVQPLSAEKLFAVLKIDFSDYINEQLGSNLAIEYAHVFNEINITIPEVIEGLALILPLAGDERAITVIATSSDYNTTLLEEQMIGFLEMRAG